MENMLQVRSTDMMKLFCKLNECTPVVKYQRFFDGSFLTDYNDYAFIRLYVFEGK